MSSSEVKKAKRRRNKRGRVGQKHGVTDEPSDTTFNCDLEVNNKPMEDVRLVEGDDSDILNSHWDRNSDIIFGSERCLLCRCERPTSMNAKGAGKEGSQDDTDSSIPLLQVPLWVCPDCKKVVEEEQKRGSFDFSLVDYFPTNKDSPAPFKEYESNEQLSSQQNTNPCSCDTCIAQKSCEAEHLLEQKELKGYWDELKRVVHQVYRDAGLLLSDALTQQNILPSCGGPLPSIDHLKELIHRLCIQDHHKLYLCLEAQVRLYIVDMRLQLLHLLASGGSTNSQGKSFARALLEEYSKLCAASRQLSPILHELETKHLKQFNLTWELVNRHLFHSIVYSDPILQGGLPDFFSQTRSGNNSRDKCHDAYSSLKKMDDEMTVISVVWRDAQQLIEDYNQEKVAARAKQQVLRNDWELFTAHWKLMEEEILKNTSLSHRCSYEGCSSRSSSLTHSHSGEATASPEGNSISSSSTSFHLSCCNHSHSCGQKKSFSKQISGGSQHSIHVPENGTAIQASAVMKVTEGGVQSVQTSSASNQTVYDIPVICTRSNTVSNTKECNYCSKLQPHLHCHHKVSENHKGGSTDVHIPVNRNKHRHCNQGVGSISMSLSVEATVSPGITGSENTTGNKFRKISSEAVLPLTKEDLSEGKPCECHVCVQLKDHFTFNSHTTNSVSLQVQTTDLPKSESSCSVQVIQSGATNSPKANSNSSALSKPFHHVPWSINLDVEAQEALQEQIYLIIYGDWSFDMDSSRTLLNSCRYSDLGLLPPVNGSASKSNNFFGCCHSETQTSVPEDESEIPTRPASPVSPASSTDSQTGSNSNSKCSQSTKCQSERHCSNHHCWQSDEHCSTSMSKASQVTTSDNSTTTSPASSSVSTPSLQHSGPRHNQNGNGFCEDPECDSHLPEEESVDDTCSEQSSSTTASNQRENRLCDCCYCEVFGHGMPAMAPVSKNYPEMRERLRLQLSKRKAEGIVGVKRKKGPEKQPDTVNTTINTINTKSITELLSYINGPEDQCPNPNINRPVNSKAAKKQKKKQSKKTNDKLQKGGDTQNEPEDAISEEPRSCQRETFQILMQKKHEQDQPSCSRNSNMLLIDAPCQQSRPSVIINARLIDGAESVKDEPPKLPLKKDTCKEKGKSTAKPNQPSPPMKQPVKETLPPKKTINNTACQSTSTVFLNGDVSSAKKGMLNNISSHPKKMVKPVQQSIPSNSEKHAEKKAEEPSKQDKCKANGINTATDNLKPNTVLVCDEKPLNGDLSQNLAKLSLKGKKTKKKKGSLEDGASPDEVFKPKDDIDLEDGELDELEKELEAFKRFCFNSVPLANKEKVQVNVNLKDVFKKKGPIATSST